MSKEVIQDYGRTIDPSKYNSILKAHPYISQSDYKIRCIIRKLQMERSKTLHMYEFGCGPGRITFDLARIANTQVIGFDISESFINYATSIRSLNPCEFRKQDCSLPIGTWDGPLPTVDVIIMQGLMHHMHGQERTQLLLNCYELLKNDGVLIIGDEFIRNYDDERRMIHAAQFYCHIIDESNKGGFDELAREEAKNLIDDCLSGTKYAGLATEETFNHIYRYSKQLNDMFYQDGLLRSEGYNQTQNLLRGIRESVKEIIDSDADNFNRGDYKISITKFIDELARYKFINKEIYRFGPVEELGGMGVLVFMKK